jgi:transposase
MQALRARQRGEKLFDGDATRWDVCENMPGKTGHRWSLGVTRAASGVCYPIAPSRGAAVPKAHCAGLRKDLPEVGLVGARDSADQSLAKDHEELLLAFCWAHVRRECLSAARSWPELAPGMWQWLEAIRTLDRLNAARLAVWDAPLPLADQAPAFAAWHRALTTHVRERQARYEMYRRERPLHRAKRQVLASRHHHWDGLTVFVARPEVAMDHHAAERARRNPVVGRKNYYGSGSIWSARLAAMLWSVLHTVVFWGLKPRHWWSALFHACAAQGGKTPTDLHAFLPWQMTDERQAPLAQPAPVSRAPCDSMFQAGAAFAGNDTSSRLTRLALYCRRRQPLHLYYPSTLTRERRILLSGR